MNRQKLQVFENTLKANQPSLTDEQIHAVTCEGKVLVSASAGSGKTTSLVMRLISEIGRGTPLSRILVLTYNVAAGEELRARLASELYDMAAISSGDTRAYFRKAVDDLPLAHIGTTHSFCAGLLRENFERLNLSPVFNVLDDASEAAYADEALSKTFDVYDAKDDVVYQSLADVFSLSRGESNFREVIKDLFRLIDVQPERDSFAATVKKCYTSVENSLFTRELLDAFEKRLKAYIAECDALTPVLTVAGREDLVDRLASVKTVSASLLTADLSKFVAAANKDYAWCALKKGKKDSTWAEAAGRATTLCKRFVAFIDNVRKKLPSMDIVEKGQIQNADFIGKLLEMVGEFEKQFVLIKDEHNALSFNDLEHKTVELLQADGERIRADYDALFVDEYQDANPTQEAIYDSLCGDNAVFVGDVKQSIYGFRLAEPKLFLERQKRYAAGEGENASFNRNFRSTDGILNFVNAIFDVVMSEESAEVDYKRTARFVTKANAIGPDVQIHLFMPTKSERRQAKGDYKLVEHQPVEEMENPGESEGRFIADEIRNLVGRAKTKDGRLLSYGDIAVLFRSRSSAKRIISVLQDQDIPLDIGTFSNSATLPETELINFLRVLDNPRQDIPLAGFMLSVFGGFTEAELAQVSLSRRSVQNRDKDLYDAVLEYALQNDELALKVRNMLDKLEKYRIKASFKNVSELMVGIVADFSYDAYLMRGGDSDSAELNRFVASVAKLEENDSLSRYLDYYAHTSAVAQRVSVSGGDRVHISTFHAYKGLEIPVVFVAEVDKRFSLTDAKGDVCYTGKGFIGMNYFDFDNRVKYPTLSKFAVETVIKRKDVKEEMRLFYVALTRAQQYLYVTGKLTATAKDTFGVVPCYDGASSLLDFVSDAIAAGSLPSIMPILHDECGVRVIKRACAPNLSSPLKEDVAAIEQGRAFKYPHSEATKMSVKFSVSALNADDEESLTPRVFEAKTNIGTLYHRVMEHIDYAAMGVDGVKNELAVMLDEGYFTQEEIGQIKPELIVRLLETPIMDIARHSTCMREQSFMMLLPAKEALEGKTDSEDNVLVQGVIDLAIRGEQTYIVDFKYSSLGDEDLENRYKNQLYLYKKAFERAFQTKVDHIMLYSFVRGEFAEIK